MNAPKVPEDMAVVLQMKRHWQNGFSEYAGAAYFGPKVSLDRCVLSMRCFRNSSVSFLLFSPRGGVALAMFV